MEKNFASVLDSVLRSVAEWVEGFNEGLWHDEGLEIPPQEVSLLGETARVLLGLNVLTLSQLEISLPSHKLVADKLTELLGRQGYSIKLQPKPAQKKVFFTSPTLTVYTEDFQQGPTQFPAEFAPVLKRLSYERLIITALVPMSRVRLTFSDFAAAAESHPNLWAVLPAIFLYKKNILHHADDVLRQNPKMQKFMRGFFDPSESKALFAIPKGLCHEVAQRFKNYRDGLKNQTRLYTKTFRFSAEDVTLLTDITEKMRNKSMTETLSLLLKEKARSLLA